MKFFGDVIFIKEINNNKIIMYFKLHLTIILIIFSRNFLIFFDSLCAYCRTLDPLHYFMRNYFLELNTCIAKNACGCNLHLWKDFKKTMGGQGRSTYEIFRWLTFYVKLKYLFVYEWFIEDVMKNLFECRNKKYQICRYVC